MTVDEAIAFYAKACDDATVLFRQSKITQRKYITLMDRAWSFVMREVDDKKKLLDHYNGVCE